MSAPAAAVSASPSLTPPLKWAGGKRWQLPHLRTLWAGHEERRLIEPFCGGLAVALGLGPRRALLNDVNPHLINFYRYLKSGLRTRLPMENSEDAFYRHRERFNRLLISGGQETREAAALFYYLNRTAYNGLCRFNSSGTFNVPFGRYARIAYRKDFSPFAALFAHWEFTCLDFERIPLDLRDLVYADPPYDVPFTRYAKEDFTWDDQVRAAEWLARHRGPVILSNQATDRIVALYRRLGFALQFLSAPRRISCTGDRSRATEVLALKGF